jgi:cytochrome c oxidase subunit IV
MSESHAMTDHSHHAHGAGHGARPADAPQHVGWRKYAMIGVILAIITALEVAVFYIDALAPVLVPVLLVLTAGKFFLVVLYYMHLKMDHPIFGRVFWAPHGAGGAGGDRHDPAVPRAADATASSATEGCTCHAGRSVVRSSLALLHGGEFSWTRFEVHISTLIGCILWVAAYFHVIVRWRPEGAAPATGCSRSASWAAR